MPNENRILSVQFGSNTPIPVGPSNSNIPSASTVTPLMDGTASIGSSTTFARGDHVHPSDTTKANISSPAFTGVPTAPTPTTGISNTIIPNTSWVQSEISSAISTYSPPTASTTTPGIVMLGTGATTAATGDHVHGSITNAGAVNTTVAIASGDRLLIADSSDSSKVKATGITFGSSSTYFLNNAGSWANISGPKEIWVIANPVFTPNTDLTYTAPGVTWSDLDTIVNNCDQIHLLINDGGYNRGRLTSYTVDYDEDIVYFHCFGSVQGAIGHFSI